MFTKITKGAEGLPEVSVSFTVKCGNVNVCPIPSWFSILSWRTSPGFTVIVGFGAVLCVPTCHSTLDAIRVTGTFAAAAGPEATGIRSNAATIIAGTTHRFIETPRAPSPPTYLRISPSPPRAHECRKTVIWRVRIDAPGMSWTQQEIRELKVNRYLIVDEEPCRILSIQMSKPGKHGEAKARLEVVGLFDGQKRSIVHPVTHKVRVPLIDKKKAQVLSIHGNAAQLMDLGSYETFDIPVDQEFAGALKSGDEILYVETMGRRKLTRP